MMASSPSSSEATQTLVNATKNQPYNFRSRKSGSNQTSRDNENNSSSRNDDDNDSDNGTARQATNGRRGRLDSISSSTFDDEENNNNNSVGVEMEQSSRRTRTSRASQPNYNGDDDAGGDDDEEDYNSGSDDDNNNEEEDNSKQPSKKNNKNKSKKKASKNKTNDDNKHAVMKNVREVMVSSDIIWEQPKIKTSGPMEEEHFGEFEDKETMAEKAQKANVAKYGGRDIKYYKGQQPQVQQMLERSATSTTLHSNIKPYTGEQPSGAPYRSETLMVLPLELYNPEQNELSAFCTNCLTAVNCKERDQITGRHADDHVAMCNPIKLPLDDEGKCPCRKSVNDEEYKDNTRGFYRHATYCCSTHATANSEHQPKVQALIGACIDDDVRCPSVLQFNGACAPGADVRSETITTVPINMYVESEHSRSAFCTHCNSVVNGVIGRDGKRKKKTVEKHALVCNPRDFPLVGGICPCNKSRLDFPGREGLSTFIKHCKQEHPEMYPGVSDEEENEESEEDEDESMWSLVAVSKARQIRSNNATKCDGINGGQCTATACCKWSSVDDDGVAVVGVAPWFGCLECQKKECNGWPEDGDDIPINSLEDDDRVAMLEMCVPPSFSYRKRARELPFTTTKEAEAASNRVDHKRRRKK